MNGWVGCVSKEVLGDGDHSEFAAYDYFKTNGAVDEGERPVVVTFLAVQAVKRFE